MDKNTLTYIVNLIEERKDILKNELDYTISQLEELKLRSMMNELSRMEIVLLKMIIKLQ